MRLLKLEIKRVLKSRRTLILLAAVMLLSVIMAWLSISFESINRLNEDGTVTELDGLAAIEYKRSLYVTTYGEVTPESLKEALETYQKYTKEYGSVDSEDFPLAISLEKITPIRPLLKVIQEAYADPDTGIAADLLTIDPDDVGQNFYERCRSHLDDVMKNEQKNYLTAQTKASDKYAEVETPFFLYAGFSKDAFDYVEFYILFLAILCVAISAPVFSNEYQTGADSILRTTKHGRVRLAVTKIGASCVIYILTYVVGMAVHLMILNMAFGTDCLKTSIQMLFSVINLSDYDLGKLQIVLGLAGLLSLLATVSCTMFVSAKAKDSMMSLLISIVILFVPLFVYVAIGANWMSSILPSAGIGLQNNFLYQLANFNYLHIGKASFWTPNIILISAAIEIPVFLFLAIRSYTKHQVV